MPKTSAGVLPFRRTTDGALEVFIAHMGGPLWARRDAGGWSIVKGEYDPALETPEQVARREFTEEIGIAPPEGDWADLGTFKQKSGKLITAFAVEVDDLSFVASNTFDLEWPRGSGRVQSFPEVDRAEWFDLDLAREKLVGGQVPALDALLALATPNA